MADEMPVRVGNRVVQRLDENTLAVWNPEAKAWDYQNVPEEKAGASALESVGIPLQAAGRSTMPAIGQGLLTAPGMIADAAIGLSNFVSGKEQVGANITEQIQSGDAYQSLQQKIDDNYAFADAAVEANPGLSFVGNLIGSLPQLPGRVPGALQGAAETAGTGGLTALIAERKYPEMWASLPEALKGAINMVEGGMLGMIGRPGGRKIRAMRIAEQQRRMPEGTRQRARQEAADRLLSDDSGEIPLSEYQRTGDPRAGAKEQVEATARGRGKGLLAERQQEALGESFGQALGLENPGGRLDPTFMGKARDIIGDRFGDILDDVDRIDLEGLDLSRVVNDPDGGLATLPEPGKVAYWSKRLEDLQFSAEGMSGKQYQRMRRKINDRATQLYNSGNTGEADYLAALVDELDNVLEGAVGPENARNLAEARRQYKMLHTINRGAAIDKQGYINPVSAQNKLEQGYRGARFDDLPSGPTGSFIRQLRDYNQVVIPYRTSNTAELLLPWIMQSNPGMSLKSAKANAAALVDEILSGEVGAAQAGIMGAQQSIVRPPEAP